MKRFCAVLAACALLACAAKAPITPGIGGEWRLDTGKTLQSAPLALLFGALGLPVSGLKGLKLSVDPAAATARLAPLATQSIGAHLSLALRQEDGGTIASFADGPEFDLRLEGGDTLVLSTRGPIGASLAFTRAAKGAAP